MLYCAVLRCSVLYCTVLYCTMLYYAVTYLKPSIHGVIVYSVFVVRHRHEKLK